MQPADDNTSHNNDVNAFRVAEKKYKLYKGINTEFSQVIDFSNLEHNSPENAALIQQLPWGTDQRRAFCLRRADLAGLVVLPGALEPAQQRLWTHVCLSSYTQPPHKSNLDPFYGPVGAQISALFPPAPPPHVPLLPPPAPASAPPTAPSQPVPSPVELLKKLRWVTLGFQYDWTNRKYPSAGLPFPPELAAFSASLAAPVCPTFAAQAAIVNFYPLDGFLCGHLDDAEPYRDAPIVSISLGNAGVFLLGGRTRAEPPVAMFVRSGDVVLMSGQTRQAYHGVPRIIAGTCPPALLDPPGPVSDFVRTARININVRQVHG